MSEIRKVFGVIASAQGWRRAWVRLGVTCWLIAGSGWLSGCGAPTRSEPLQARLELAAGPVELEQAGQKALAFSGTALLPGARLVTGPGARALVRLSNGSAVFLRGGSQVALDSGWVDLAAGELWLDAPPTEREAIGVRIGQIQVHAVDAGISIQQSAEGVLVYCARGTATITAPGGRVELRAGEQAQVHGPEAPTVAPVAFWEDWTGGMADHSIQGGLAGSGSGKIYGVDLGAAQGSPAMTLEIGRQSVRTVIRSGLAETEVDQTFFNPNDRELEGWYWFSVPSGANVTGFAVETDGQLVEGEFIERREAAAQYGQAVASGHSPALLEWIDARTFRARIYPVPAAGTRRVVLRYLQLLPTAGGVMRYVYPLQSEDPVRIGEFALSVDLGEAGTHMNLTTLADARVEDGGRRISMRRSGYVPRADFMLEAQLTEPTDPVRFSRAAAGGDTADYLMVRYTPDIDWLKVQKLRGDVVVVVDTSAASDEASRAVKAAAAEAILRALSSEDRFALVSLDVRPTVLHPAEGLASASEEEIGLALERLAEHSTGGATDLSALFDVSLARLHGAEQPAVIYVGDGLATSGEMGGEQLAERLRRALSTSRARLFTVGVGPYADRALLAALAQAGGGQAFQIDSAQEATERALNLVAALKTPTMTDFEIDLGAGLDEMFVSANGKVTDGEEVVILARTHHDLPSVIKVKGRLGGEAFEKSYSLKADDPVVAGVVPRLWAAEVLRRMIGAAGDPAAVRGKIMQLGLLYGLMTPYTSILALESEQAYQQQGIQRNRSPLKGPRLSSLAEQGEASLALGVAHTVGFGCSKVSEEAPPAQAISAPGPAAKQPGAPSVEYAHKGMKDFAERSRNSEASAVGGAPSAPQEQKAAAPARLAMNRPGVVADEEMELSAGDDQAGPSGRPSDRPRKSRAAKRDDERQFMQGCSDAARRPLRERVILWRKRFHTANSAQDLVHLYQAAWYACEMPDWQSEATFLRVLQPAIRDEGTAAYVLKFFESRPEVQRYLARLILRRSVDTRIVQVVENALFGDKINWATVDNELAEIADPEGRLNRLRQILTRVPDDPNGIIRQVHLLVQSGRMEEALVVGRRLRDSGLTTPFLARELGDVLANNKLDDEAVRTYSEIVEFDPDSLQSRQLLGDIYLAHGWYDPAYLQYKTLTERAPAESIYVLRLAAAAAGAGRVDEALRLERQVAQAPGRAGPDDPRRWSRLWSAARLARMLDRPPATTASPKRLTDSLKSRLKELQLFRGPGTLVLMTWEDLSADLQLVTLQGDRAVALGEATQAPQAGLSAVLLSTGELDKLALKVYLRSPSANTPIRLKRQDITWDGKDFQVKVSQLELPSGASQTAL